MLKLREWKKTIKKYANKHLSETLVGIKLRHFRLLYIWYMQLETHTNMNKRSHTCIHIYMWYVNSSLTNTA